jgi:hypothetical protein
MTHVASSSLEEDDRFGWGGVAEEPGVEVGLILGGEPDLFEWDVVFGGGTEELAVVLEGSGLERRPSWLVEYLLLF